MKELEPLPIPVKKRPPLSFQKKEAQKKETVRSSKTTRLAVDVDDSMLEKIKDYAYWEGFTQQEVAIQAFEAFLENKKIDSRPERVRNRPKVGRRPKNA